MPIDSKHPQYDKYISQWMRCRDANEGQDQIKGRGSLYLPRLQGMDEQDYEAYKLRALWYGATARTIQGLNGAVFRKPPIVEVPTAAESLMESITDDNLDVESLAMEVVTEQMTTGRQALLVDVPQDGSGLPYITSYGPEQIINWRTTTVNGREQLIRVVLREVELVDDEDQYALKEQVRYRVLSIVGGAYEQAIFDDEGVQVSETIQPRRLGRRLDFIPLRFINVTTLGAKVEKPPLLDVVDVNLSHYRTSADLEHGAHFTALPTPWLAGFPVEKKFAIGSGVAFVSDDVQAKAGMLEFTGKGLDSLRDIKSDKEQLMAVLGARMLEEQKKGVEAADTARLHRSGEAGVLSAMVGTASRGVEDVLGWAAWWAGAAPQPADINGLSFKLNTDFMDLKLPHQELQALFATLQGGGISVDTWLYNLQRGEVLPPGRTIEDERDLIEIDAGARGPVDPDGE